MNIEKDERITKHIKVLLIMKTVEIEKKQQIISLIFISKSYKKAINDFIYNPHWFQVVKNKIFQLKNNNTYIAEVSLEGANIVIYK